MGNSQSKSGGESSQLSTRQIITGLTIATAGIIGATLWFTKKKHEPKKSERSSSTNVVTSDSFSPPATVVPSSQSKPSTSVVTSSSDSTSSTPRKGIKVESPISTENWKTYSKPELGLKFKYPPNFAIDDRPQAENTVIIQIIDMQQQKNFMLAIEPHSLLMSAKAFLEKTLDPLKSGFNSLQMIKNDNVIHPSGIDAHQIYYSVSGPDSSQTACVWTTCLVSGHWIYTLQTLSMGDIPNDSMNALKAILASIELTPVSEQGQLIANSNEGFSIVLPSVYYKVNTLEDGNMILDASDSNLNSVVERIRITKHSNIHSLDDFFNDIKSKHSLAVDRGHHTIDGLQSQLVSWEESGMSHFAELFIHKNSGYLVDCQIVQENNNTSFKERALKSLNSVQFTKDAHQQIQYYTPKYNAGVDVPLKTHIREFAEPPSLMNILHSLDELKPTFTSIEFRELNQPMTSIQNFKQALENEYKAPQNPSAQQMPLADLVKSEVVQVNDQEAVRMELSQMQPMDPMMMQAMMMGKMSSEKLMTLQTSFLKSPDTVMNVVSIALESDYEKLQEQFKKIHSSFVLYEE